MLRRPAAKDFSLSKFCLFGSFAFIFLKPLPYFLALVVAIAGSCRGPQIDAGHPAHRLSYLMQIALFGVR